MSHPEHSEDKLVEWAIRFRHFFVKQRRLITRSAILVLLLIIVAGVYLANRSSVEDEAALAFEKAYSILRAESIEEKLNELDAKLREVINAYPDTFAAAKALYYLGNIQYRYRNYSDALSSYERTIDYGKTSYIHTAARLAAADCQVQLGKPDAALEGYAEVAALEPGFANQARIKRASIFLVQSKWSDARLELEAVKTSESQWSREADRLLAYLEMASRVSTPR
jgi:predicted negative regulator of RcsB-dependent stress response